MTFAVEDRLHSGLEVLRFPIGDMGVPQEAASEEFASFVGETGKNVVAHCRGGLGRTGMVVACVLVALDEHTSDEAIGVVRKARRGTVQSEEQADFVRQYEVRQRLV
jgi:protein-tyrosine phosphatase